MRGQSRANPTITARRCIPYRLLKGDPSTINDAQVLLVSSRGGKAWSFPKVCIVNGGVRLHTTPQGGWETDETVESAAKRETVEESGVRGALEVGDSGDTLDRLDDRRVLSMCHYSVAQGPLLGEFPFVSGKAVRQQRASEGKCRAFVFAMRVEEELRTWPEAGQRQRAWVRCLMLLMVHFEQHEQQSCPTPFAKSCVIMCHHVSSCVVAAQFSLPEALRVLKSDWMREAVLAWVARCGWDAAQLLGPENAPANTDA